MYNTKFILANGQEVYPGYLSSERRQVLKEQFRDKRSYMRCACKPEANLFYRISEDLRIYPEHNNYQHDVYCCRYKDDSGINRRRTAYVINEENGEVVVYTAFDPLNFSQSEDSAEEQDNILPTSDNENMDEIIVGKDSETASSSSSTAKEPKLTIRGLVRSINIDTFTERILNRQEVNSKQKFSVLVFHRMKKIRLARARRNIGELSLEKDGCRFIYLPFAGVERSIQNGFERCYVNTKAPDGKVYSNFIFPDILDKEIQKYIKTYGMDPDEHTMLAGFQYLKRNLSGKSYKVMGRIHLFRTSDIGLYCRNTSEINAFNQLQRISEENKSIKYWIPPEDENIGAIVQIGENSKKILLLFRSKKDEHIVYDKTMYVPFVIDGSVPITASNLMSLIH